MIKVKKYFEYLHNEKVEESQESEELLEQLPCIIDKIFNKQLKKIKWLNKN